MNKPIQITQSILLGIAALVPAIINQSAMAKPERVIVVQRNAGLRTAADELKAATRELSSDLRDAYARRGWPLDGRAREIDRLSSRSSAFEDATDAQPFPALRNEYADLRAAYDRSRSVFDDLPHTRELNGDIARVQDAMARVRHEYDLGAAPAAPPVVIADRGDRYDLARQIENTSDELKDTAKDIAKHGGGRGSGHEIDNALDRLSHLAKRGDDLRAVVEQHDWQQLRVSYDKLRDAYQLAAPTGLFGRSVEYKYSRLGDLIDRFGDTLGRVHYDYPERVILEHR